MRRQQRPYATGKTMRKRKWNKAWNLSNALFLRALARDIFRFEGGVP